MLKQSHTYQNILEKARWSHARGRSVFHIEQADVELGRLYTYAFRTQTIGAFHATRVALEEQAKAVRMKVPAWLERAVDLLQQLQARAVDPVPNDFRAVISGLYYYDRWSNQVIEALEEGLTGGTNQTIERIKKLFATQLESITASDGLYISSDTSLPEQGTFLVPNLNIAIVPLVYGDHHSWNTAFLKGEDSSGVSVHRHLKGAEIHLGFSPVEGRTILGNCGARINEGYAMPIPPMTYHGFDNLSGHDHFLPFIFGSLQMGGWGVFFDVEPRASGWASGFSPKEVALESAEMNHSIYLERATAQAAAENQAKRWVLIPASAAGSPETGGLELAVRRVDSRGLTVPADRYTIVSVQKGRAKISVGPVEGDLNKHDHTGIPAGISADITQTGDEPLVILEATIRMI